MRLTVQILKQAGILIDCLEEIEYFFIPIFHSFLIVLLFSNKILKLIAFFAEGHILWIPRLPRYDPKIDLFHKPAKLISNNFYFD